MDICREISKYYEEYIRCSVKDLTIFEKEPKGELTIVISDKNIIKKTSNIYYTIMLRNLKSLM